MTPKVRVTAMISRSTRTLLDQAAARTRASRSTILEDALQHHLLALRHIPKEYIIPPVLKISRRSAIALAERMRHGQATPALRRLMDPAAKHAS